MQSFNHDSPAESIPTPPMAASAQKPERTRPPVGDGVPISQSEMALPYRRSPRPGVASLYASTLTPPGSRSQSPIGRPVSRVASTSVFGRASDNALALVDGAGDSPGDPLNLIRKAFVPHIAVHTSEDTDRLLREKGFEFGLWELLRPFGERVQGKVTIRDSNGSSRTFEDYAVRFVRFGEDIEHPGPAKGLVKNAQLAPTTNGLNEKIDGAAMGSLRKGGNIADVERVVDLHLTYAEDSFFDAPHNGLVTSHGLDVTTPSPYYALYLRRLLSGLPLAPHETFAHPVACVTAISSRNASPIDTLRRLYEESSTGDRRLPSWVDAEYLRYYVLVHDDERDDITRSMSLFEQMKRNLGLHCHLLRIRGTQSVVTDDDSIPIPRCEWMSASEELADIKKTESHEGFEDPTRYIFESDATAIRTFVREMVTQSIVPTMERHVSVWNDQVASRRRGVTGRFLGLTRKWGFGGSSHSSGAGKNTGSNYDPLGFYRQDAPEAIMRKLADYALMLRDWKLAYSTYDILRGDFNNDKAWKHHAAANEMAAISLLMMPQDLTAKTRAETIDAMLESAVYSYSTRCSAPYGSLRCLVLGMELLRLRGGSSIDDAARWGTRLLDSRIVGPIGDALIKERLAVCYASKPGIGSHFWGGRRRKSALWSTLGAEAWLAQSKYMPAQRCLNEARRTYSELSTEHGIAKFGLASEFMLGMGQQLNERLSASEQREGEPCEAEDAEVDEESEALDHRGRRASLLGLPGGIGASLESAPLRSLAPEGQTVDAIEAKDDFG